MINKKYLSIILLIIFVVVAYFLLSNKSTFYSKNETTLVNDDVKNSSQFVGSFSVVLKSGDNPSEYGIAVFGKSENKTKVSIKMINFSNGIPQNASIYKGTCDNLEETKHGLANVANGSSESTLDITVDELINEFPLALVIGNAVTLSCTDIVN